MVGETGRARENKRVLQKSPEAQVRHDLGLDLRIFKEKEFRKCQEKSTMNPPTHCAIFPDQDLDATIKNCAEVPAPRAEVFVET